MRSIVTGREMAAFDAEAMRLTPHTVLVERAGAAVAVEVTALLGEVRGRRISILAGPGSNGADGRVAGRRLAARGAVVTVIDPDCSAEDLADADVIIDAAYGTGGSRPFDAPVPPPGALVVAVDLPSGLHATTGVAQGRPMAADVTVAMAAVKSGMVLADGPRLCGQIVVADIGIATLGSSMTLVTDDDLMAIPPRAIDAHKWRSAVCVVAGSQGMQGAGVLSALGALRAGSGMARLVHPVEEGAGAVAWPTELVRRPVAPADLSVEALEESRRTGAMVIGPGLGRTDAVLHAVRDVLEQRTTPVVLDADGLFAVHDLDTLSSLVGAAPHPVVITPHHGELVRLCGTEHSEADRLATVVDVAVATGATVLAKGPTTIVVDPTGAEPVIRLVTAGTPVLATAGTGDVLSGVVAALLAQGLSASEAAALGSHVHGLGAQRAKGTMIASDLPVLIGEVLGEVTGGG